MGSQKSNHIKRGLELIREQPVAGQLPRDATWWQEPAPAALTPGMLLGIGARLSCQESGILLLAGMHFTSLVQENRAGKIPVTHSLPLLPCLLAWSSSRGSPTPSPDLPTPATRSSSFKKIKLFSSTPPDNQAEENQSASGFYQHSYIFTRPYCTRLFGVLLIVMGLSL